MEIGIIIINNHNNKTIINSDRIISIQPIIIIIIRQTIIAMIAIGAAILVTMRDSDKIRMHHVDIA